ncbi:MAG: LPXTG cell wall anchor domain-containing protein [Oscillospiraceae bacterium]|nr:LPXTG cell wall anchor domain-containing protein [Oscillospiraceae bacterium]
MKKKILVSVLIALMLGIVQPIGTIGYNHQETTSEQSAEPVQESGNEDDETKDKPTDMIYIDRNGNITLKSEHASESKVNTLELSLKLKMKDSDEKIESVDFNFSPELNDGEELIIEDKNITPEMLDVKAAQALYNKDSSRLTIYLSDTNTLFAEDGSLNLGTIEVDSLEDIEISVEKNSLSYVYHGTVTSFAVAIEREVVEEEPATEEETTMEETTPETTTTTTTTETTTTTTTTTTETTTTTTTEEIQQHLDTVEIEEETTTEATTTTTETTTTTTTTEPETTKATTTTTEPETTKATTTTTESETTKATTTTTEPETTKATTTTTESETTKATTTTTEPETTKATTTTKPETTKVTTTTESETTKATTTTTTEEVTEVTTEETTEEVTEVTTEETTEEVTEVTTEETTEEVTEVTTEETTEEVTEVTTEETTEEVTEVTTEETTEETTTTIQHIASDEELCDWAINDYEDKTGVTPVNAEITEDPDGQYEITLTDQDDEVLDVYVIDPNTGIGTDSNHEEVNLPQTGNNSLTNMLIAFGSLMTTAFGFLAVKSSGVLRRKKNEK